MMWPDSLKLFMNNFSFVSLPKILEFNSKYKSFQVKSSELVVDGYDIEGKGHLRRDAPILHFFVRVLFHVAIPPPCGQMYYSLISLLGSLLFLQRLLLLLLLANKPIKKSQLHQSLWNFKRPH